MMTNNGDEASNTACLRRRPICQPKSIVQGGLDS